MSCVVEANESTLAPINRGVMAAFKLISVNLFATATFIVQQTSFHASATHDIQGDYDILIPCICN